MDNRVKLLISYDILDDNQQTYYQYVVGEFLPQAQAIGLALIDAWHTAYGDYPARLLSFVARDRATLDAILQRDEWRQLEEKLHTFVVDYQRKIVPYRDRFQF
ncbi:MAG TPA: hypothetical protein VJG32_02715 [Anaerolineae bacterium]|nr:hypothetical protein [Anaerolineae bacterium]